MSKNIGNTAAEAKSARHDAGQGGKSIPLKDRLRYRLSTAKGVAIEYDLGKYERRIREIPSLSLAAKADRVLLESARVLKEAARAGKPPDPVPVFALAAEFCRRRLALEPFETQLIAGLAMSEGKLVQMRTGEGKTLAAVFPVCLEALSRPGVHVLTANDYLAKRDAEWMGPVFEAFGLEIAFIREGMGAEERKRAYAADVVYLTAKEAGFDYLRDQLRYSALDYVQKPFGMALVDEADFILIDEARIPLIIAGKSATDGIDLMKVHRAALRLREGIDFEVDRKASKVSIGRLEGQKKAAGLLGVEGIHEREGFEAFARLYASLHALKLLRRDFDYIVRDGKIELVDGFTGRIAQRRKWPYGVQAALEVKEGLAPQEEGRIFGSITVQNFIGLYPKLAAMTATALPSAEEFSEVFGLTTVVVPTERPCIRIDRPDHVFASRRAKLKALVREIGESQALGRPVLVGTGSVCESEELACAIRASGIACEVLNAKNDEREAELIAKAGGFGAVTISTNMAGRGTDIRLGEDERAYRAGGLYVIGTNRHESERIDDQLRGRAGRQGEPGESRFFLSLEDPLFLRYGIPAFLPKECLPHSGGASSGEDQDAPLPSPAGKEVARAQRLIAGQNQAIRKNLRRYSEIVEYDRLSVRALRDKALLEGGFPERIEELLAEAEAKAGAGSGIRARALEEFLSRVDNFWADQLDLIDEVREGVHLVRYSGKDPLREFIGTVGRAFEAGLEALIESTAESCLRRGESGPEAEPSEKIEKPSSTWTYLVEEEGPPGFSLSAISSADIGRSVFAALPLLVLDGIEKLRERLGGRKGGKTP